jgi:hypothetical protein
MASDRWRRNVASANASPTPARRRAIGAWSGQIGVRRASDPSSSCMICLQARIMPQDLASMIADEISQVKGLQNNFNTLIKTSLC